MPAPDRPNVLVCVWDSVRADALEPYGAPDGSTPTAAELARRGRLVAEAYAAAPWTVPSHASMFTGLLPRAAGLTRPPSTDPASADPVLEGLEDRLLSSVFRRAGYETGAVSSNLWLTAGTGWGRGFDRFESFWNHRVGGVEGGIVSRARWLAGAVSAGRDDGAAAAGGVLGSWAAEPRDRPFLWFCNVIEAHSPHMPPRSHSPLGPVGRFRAAREAVAHTSFLALGRKALGVHEIPPGVLDRIRSLYRGAVSYLDAWLGGVLERLDDAGVLDDTLVVLTSDHGERLGENGFVGHAFALGQTLLRVPLTAAGPGADALPQDGPVSLAALPRMLATAVGLEDHPWQAEDLPSGAVVAHYDPPHGFEGSQLSELARSWGASEDAVDRIQDRLIWVSEGSWSLLRREGPAGRDLVEAFDLKADPLEASPLDPSRCPPEVRSVLDGALGHPANREAALQAGDRPSPAAGADDAERARLEEQMRLLGYL